MSVTTVARGSSSESGPSPAEVRGNNWTALPRLPLGGWTPSRSVSVVIPAFGREVELERTLAALREQTYPRSLTEILVVDDGSDPPLVVDEDRHPGVRLIRRQRDPNTFGSGSARNFGATAASGEILMFMDSDIVAEPHLVEAHGRWHHLVADAVVLGVPTHVDVDGISAEDVSRAARARDISGLLGGRHQQPVEWVDDVLTDLDRLRRSSLDGFRVLLGGNYSLRAETCKAVGGMHVFSIRGTEDTHFGYQLWTYGALFIPDPEAASWHQGARFFQGPQAKRARHDRAPVLANAIPHSRFRRITSRRVYEVPLFHVTLPVGAAAADDVVKTVDSLLVGVCSDVRIDIEVPRDYPESDWLARTFVADPRVSVCPVDREGATVDTDCRAAFHMTVPPGVVVGKKTLTWIYSMLNDDPTGALHITIPGKKGSLIHVRWTRALARARRLTEHRGGALDVAIGELFGELWASGLDFDLQRDGAPAPEPRAASPLSPKEQRRVDCIRRTRLAVARALPRGAPVAVVSRGDEELLAHKDRPAWHFPQVDGEYAGHHPANSREALAHLRSARRSGAAYLVVPATSSWWLDHYGRFAKRLERRYGRIYSDESACVIFDLRTSAVRCGVRALSRWIRRHPS